MVNRDEKIVMKAIALCYKPFLKPEEAMIYCNPGRTQLNKNCDAFGIYKNEAGYFKRDDLDKMMSGIPSLVIERPNQPGSKFRLK